MRSFGLALTLLSSASASILSGQDVGPQPDPATRTELLGLREAVWRAWFSNDKAAFLRIVPEELVALGWGGGPWDDRAASLSRMAEFAGGGMKLKSLSFPRNVFQRYGDVVILYTAFQVVLVDHSGKTEETSGRGTEIFVRRQGRWIHTGWHLDAVGS